MAIRTHESVFLGIVVQPKTLAPIYVERQANTERTITILGVRTPDIEASLNLPPGPPSYVDLGSAYLNDMPDYAGPTEVTGLPRAHTPSGVTAIGGGYGTCLYTGLVLLATAEHDGQLVLPKLIGSGRGISSTETDKSRSASADRWWRAALARGITEQEDGTTSGDDPEIETEEITDEDLKDYVSRTSLTRITNMVHDALGDSDWRATDITIKVDLERDVEADRDRGPEDITVDIYTMDSAEKHNLVACRETTRGSMFAWANDAGFKGKAFKETLLALNVSREDMRMVGKIALVAQSVGATESEITHLVMRAKLGVDVVSRKVLFEEPPSPKELVEVAEERRHLPPPRERGHRVPPHPNPQLRIRRNPPPALTPGDRQKIDRDLSELERRREDLGWNELEDLP